MVFAKCHTSTQGTKGSAPEAVRHTNEGVLDDFPEHLLLL